MSESSMNWMTILELVAQHHFVYKIYHSVTTAELPSRFFLKTFSFESVRQTEAVVEYATVWFQRIFQ